MTPEDTAVVVRMARLYRLLLRLYPASHRRDYGELMEQLFRDQCRDAQRERGTAGLCAVWSRVVPDLISSTIQEHVTNLTTRMKTLGTTALSHVLLAAAIGLALLANPPLVGPVLATVCLYLSIIALFARAFAEWFRPPGESWKAIAWGVAIFVAYGFIMPVWAKLHVINDTNPTPAITFFLVAPIFLNTLVPVLKALVTRRSQTA